MASLGAKPRLMILKIVIENFKSYGGVKEIGPFHKSFSSVVGPNGSGKSNVIDAMLFVFGKKASQMRFNKVRPPRTRDARLRAALPTPRRPTDDLQPTTFARPPPARSSRSSFTAPPSTRTWTTRASVSTSRRSWTMRVRGGGRSGTQALSLVHASLSRWVQVADGTH
jgi:energy-coupling factor transporter ATP-binding protein EcfA2